MASSRALARTLFRTILRSGRRLRCGGGSLRLIEPVDVNMHGFGRFQKRVAQTTMLLSATPTWFAEAPGIRDQIMSAVVERPIVGSGGPIEEVLTESRMVDLVKQAFRKGGPNGLQDGFAFARALAEQKKLHLNTSVHVTLSDAGNKPLVRVEGTSVRDKRGESGSSMRNFCYRMSVENLCDRPFILSGRQWDIFGELGIVASVIKGSPGVVGLTPLIKPGARFVYASGTPIPSLRGFIKGSFQMVMADTSLGEEPETFDAVVAPVPLGAEDREA